MKSDLPRYTETQSGDAPDAYFIDGERITPISLIVETEGALPPSVRQPFPTAMATLDQTIAAVTAVEAAVAVVENGMTRLPKIEVPVMPDALRVARENSARLAAWQHADASCVVIFDVTTRSNRILGVRGQSPRKPASGNDMPPLAG